MTAKPKYYFNLDGNITDGEKEYSLYNIEDVVGGLSISSGLKDRYVLYGRNSLLDLLNELNDKCEVLEIENESFEDGATRYAELYHKSLKENEQLKELIKEKCPLCGCDLAHYYKVNGKLEDLE